MKIKNKQKCPRCVRGQMIRKKDVETKNYFWYCENCDNIILDSDKETVMNPYVKSDVRLNGKALDKALKERANAKKERMAQRLSTHMAAKNYGIKATDVLAWEYGYDLCPHKEFEDQIGGVPIPRLIFKTCKKCGMVAEKTTEKINDSNMKRAYKVYKKCVKGFKASKKK